MKIEIVDVPRQNVVFADHPFEIYITDPDQEPDPAKHITHVYWPVA